MQVTIAPESGLTYRLDLLEGSELLPGEPNRQARALPIYEHGYGYFRAGAGHFTQRDQSRCLYQVFLTHKGAGKIEVDGQEFLAGPGSICLLNCGRPHRYATVGEIWEHEWVNFAGSGCPVYYDLINPGGFRVYAMPEPGQFLALMREIRGHMQNFDMLSCVHVTTGIVRLLDAMYALAMDARREGLADQQENILRSAQFIRENYARRLTLDEICKVALLSKYYYTRSFKRVMGTTPHDYLNTVRIAHAKSILLTTAATIDEVAWKTGFSGSKNLIRQFKQSTGVTPGEYRAIGGECEAVGRETP